MKFTQSFLATLLASAAIASPTATLDKRATTICGQWDSVVTGTYTVYQDLWNKDTATSGSQCTTVNSLSGTTLAWSTSWTWAGASNQVKSFANVVVKSTVKQVSAISSIPSTWKWSYTGTSIVADVAYDLFTSSTSTGSNEYEIMIWLAAIGGAGPISSTGSTIATPTIAGVKWNLYSGPNGAMTVYSFVAQSQATSFSGDLKAFLTYLSTNFKYPTSQYVLSIGAGTEPFTGSNAVFTTSAYSAVVN
ncbi:glycosyl hydrolase family 12 [Phlyctema vagabunda]|uniref:Glycosyl hydrolase family 12 n=1 Tax=Phlyctema vagabunda TaxID=108571 RepID=A0ABR4PMV2_9HELO